MAEAMYRQIADDLRGKIESGEIAPGAQLPTEIALMAQYNASRNTVRDAIKLLTSLGLVEARAGQGTFAVEKIEPYVSNLSGDLQANVNESEVYLAEVKAGGRVPTASDPRVEVQRASDVVADALRIEPGAQVVSRHQQRFIDGSPWSLQTTFYPMRLVQQGATRLLEATDIQPGTVSYLADCGVKQVGYRDSISVRTPDENEMAFFRLPVDGRVSVFEVFRVGFSEEGERFRLTITVYPGDRNRFVINVGEVPKRDTGVATGDRATGVPDGAASHQGN
jgi:GntR family transcriptional regulator